MDVSCIYGTKGLWGEAISRSRLRLCHLSREKAEARQGVRRRDAVLQPRKHIHQVFSSFLSDQIIFNFRFGSFKQGSISERLADPQGFRPADNAVPAPKAPIQNPSAIARPRASDLMYVRQASFRGLSQLSGSSPFKRQASLRLEELPSNLARWILASCA